MDEKELLVMKYAVDIGKEAKQDYILKNLENAVCVMSDDESPKSIVKMYNLPYIYGGFYGRNFI